MLFECPAWETHRITAFMSATKLYSSKAIVQHTATKLTENKTALTNHIRQYTSNIPIKLLELQTALDEQGDESIITLSTTNQDAARDTIKQQARHNIASILSNTYNPRILQMQQPLYWIFIAIFMKIISPQRSKALRQYPHKYQKRTDSYE